MLKIALTGGIGSGKTTVAQVFKHLNIPLYIADTRARELMNTDDDIKSGIISLFGIKAYQNGNLNTSYIASIVFNSQKKLESLNQLVHPAVRKDFISWINEHADAPYVIQEAAILFESGHNKYFDQIIFVNAEKELRIRRVMERDGVSRQDVLKRMDQQWSAMEKMKLSDHLINNNEDDLIIHQVLNLHNKFLSLQG